MKSLKGFVFDNKIHFLVWSVMLSYLFFAHDLYTKYFLDTSIGGKPIQYDGVSPVETTDIQFGVNGLNYIDRDQYVLTGWTLYQNLAASRRYDRYVVLSSDRESYYFLIPKPKKKFYIYLSKNSIRPGTYKLGFVFRHKSNGHAFFMETNRTITRTPNFLMLNEKE
jgi:hypothetical protein